MSFKIRTLGEVVRFGGGKPIKPGGDGRYPAYGSNGVIGGSDEYLYENAVIVGRVGANCGSVVYCSGKFWPSDNTLTAFPAGNDLDVRFLSFLLSNADLRQFAGGAAQPLVTQTVLRRVEVPIPPLPVQQRIARILSAYDDLIQNCERRIRVLDEMARTLYREWFVRFHYPGHESVPLVESPLGRIPEGWRASPIAMLIDAHIGGGWGSEAPDEDHTEPAWVIRGTDIPAASAGLTTSVPHRYHTGASIKSRVLEPLDIVFETSGGSKGQPVGRALLITKELLQALPGTCICASFCKKIRPSASLFDPYLLFLSFAEGYTSGELATYQVQSTGISNFKWTEYIASVYRAIPPSELQGRFRQFVEPWFTGLATLGREAQNLRKTRDLLLPRLLAGQLSVEGAA